MTLGQLQRRLAVLVARLQFDLALLAEDPDAADVAGQAGQVKRRRAKVVGLLQIHPAVHQQFDQLGVTLVCGPVQRGIAVYVSQMP